MKPNFALNLTDDRIALLHRTAKGWLKIGETPFDAPDLEEALDYLRKTALGLEPGGFATKLVIPNSQLRYATIDAPGPGDDERRRQIGDALEASTPLRRDEIVFDWSGDGPQVQVAAVARETLAEAETFATQHRFNPVSFVAIPEAGSFEGEPWFGTTAAAAETAEPVERDRAAITFLGEGGRKPRPATAKPGHAAVAPQADGPAPAQSAAGAEPAAPPPAAGSAAGETQVSEPPPQGETEHEAPAPARPPVSPEPEARHAGTETPERVAETVAAPAPAPLPPAPETGAQAGEAADILPRFRPRAESGAPPLAPAEPQALRPASAPRATESPAAPAPAFDPPAPFATPARQTTGPALTVTAVTRTAPDARPAGSQGDGPRPPVAPPVADRPGIASAPAPRTTGAADPADEAPFTHVADPAASTLPDEAPDLSPAAAIIAAASRRAAAEDDDLPPAPPPAVSAAYAGRSKGKAAPPLSAAVAPSVSAPPAPPEDRPEAATAARTARGQPIEDLPPLPRPLQAPARPGPVPAPAGGRGKARGKPASPPQPVTRTGSAGRGGPDDAARSLGASPFAKRQAVRGKPRYLGLVLTAILLICLALVAAWSSFFLASRQPSGDSGQTAIASVDGGSETLADPAGDPTIGDEMAADGIDGGLPDPATQTADAADTTDFADNGPPADTPVDTGTAEAAPATGAAGESPPAVALNEAGEEVFRSTADAPPPALDPLALPAPQASAEVAPPSPMPPPAWGTVYQFDADGLIVAQKEGIVAPDGYMIRAGKPPRLPPPRSATAEEAAAAARNASLNAAPDAATPVEAASAVSGEGSGETASIPAAAGLVAPTATADAASGDGAPPANPDPDLANRRPKLRPEAALAVPGDGAGLAPADESPAPDSREAGLRPRARPGAILAAGEAARAATAAASLAAEAPAVVEPAAADAAPAANPSLLAISRRPAARPGDFSRAVEAAVAAAVRMPEPQPEPEPAAAPTQKPSKKGKKATAEVKPDEQSEIDEPEVAAAPMPKIPTKASVAKQATFKNAINLSKVNLIGVYGTPSNRHALVRLANGKYRKVFVGDSLDGGTVKAITQNEVRYQKGGRLVALALPRG